MGTSFPASVMTQYFLIPNDSSDSPQALSFPFLSRMIHNSQLATGIAESGPAQLMGMNNPPGYNGALSLTINNLNETAAKK